MQWSKMKAGTEEKKSSGKRILVAVGVIIIAAIIVLAGVLSQYRLTAPNAPTSPCVEVDYKTVGWFYGSYVRGTRNDTYFLLDITVINEGYSEPILSSPWTFGITVNGMTYDAWESGQIPPYLYNGTVETLPSVANQSFLRNFAIGFSALPDVAITNESQRSGIVAFELPTKPQRFILSYSPDFADYSSPKPEVKVVAK